MLTRIRMALVLVCVLGSTQAFAQNWSGDARKAGLGGVGSSDNLATEMIDDERPYRSISLPIGLIQVISNLSVFDPTSKSFSLVQAIEYAASPMHFVPGRDDSAAALSFMNDVRNASLSTNLASYRGFTPPNTILAEGLASPSWGGTIKFYKGGSGAFQGLYIGAGPYLSLRTNGVIPTQLTDIWNGTTAAVPRNYSFPQMTDDTLGQAAIAITGGYRARFALTDSLKGTERDGVYVAVNYNYLRGFRYENAHLGVRLDTDAAGLLTVNPLLTSPVLAIRQYASSGNGTAVDVGVGVVVDKWEVGVGARGIGNHIDWTGVQQTTYALGDPTKPLLSTLLSSGNATFAGTGPVPLADAHVELPVDYRANIAYHAGLWVGYADIGQGFQGASFHSGAEVRLAVIDLRGGMRYSSEIWNPTVGIGLNLSPRVGLDLAAFGTSANLERARHMALAASFRIKTRK